MAALSSSTSAPNPTVQALKFSSGACQGQAFA
eukprot:CAMPEP_0174358096 /NCGR_PEP_ID=MMETSP0811_2-20130205/39960_1 /TAXON_ID=73025 ORGANISM="Eutreptiella gymnastica-like, Strain CCMP1594" /NCGR_SAMPLE_ID=MMETSP0811_2 /ASSEMBLY_ACC=CAM_ASM_000667 /LENGTH=31 /DNA_ID= /DNA_START= /DNA_END= /DNA_ORIENTATION=